jgi:hypothetical protein
VTLVLFEVLRDLTVFRFQERTVSSITITPNSESVILSEGEVVERVAKVYVPKPTPIPQIDVYFLADTTGSMGSIIESVKSGISQILNGFRSEIDICFGVGDYKDFNSKDPYAFNHRQSPTANKALVTAAINTLSAAGGEDGSEGQLYALDQLAQPAGGSIGWRKNSKRIIVWFGDAPGHDPICKAVSPLLTADITEASVTAKLVAEKILIIAISTTTSYPQGLDDDPNAQAANYQGVCPVAGNRGQATRLTQATRGVHFTGIDANRIVNQIITSVETVMSAINNLTLVPSKELAPFVSSISPAGGYGPLETTKEHYLDFTVRYTGKKSDLEKKLSFQGTIDVVGDGAVMAKQDVTIGRRKVPVEFKVESAGADCGNSARILKSGEEINFGPYTRGLNVAVFDEITGQLLVSTTFDTFIAANCRSFAYFIETLPAGRIVALGVKDEASVSLLTDAGSVGIVSQAFQSIGSSKFALLTYRASWALIGQKGSAPGTAVEEVSATSAVSVTRSFEVTPLIPLTPVVVATSATQDHHGEPAGISVNGTKVEIAGGYQAGLNVAVVDEVSGAVVSSRAFDVFANPAAANEFVQLVDSLPAKRIVAIVMKEGNKNSPNSNPFPESVKTACMSLGSLRVHYVWEEGIWAMVGAKGAAVGTARENLDSSYHSYAAHSWGFVLGAGVSVRSCGSL